MKELRELLELNIKFGGDSLYSLMGETRHVRGKMGPTQEKIWGYQRENMASRCLHCRSTQRVVIHMHTEN